MTPAQVRRYLKGSQLRQEREHAARMSLAWHIQAMAPERSRNGRMPSLDKLINRKKQYDRKPPQTPEQMRESMIGIAHAFGGKVTKLIGPQPEHRRLPD